MFQIFKKLKIKSTMKQKAEDNLEQLKNFLTRQLEAYLRQDWNDYNRLEEQIIRVEKDL